MNPALAVCPAVAFQIIKYNSKMHRVRITIYSYLVSA